MQARMRFFDECQEKAVREIESNAAVYKKPGTAMWNMSLRFFYERFEKTPKLFGAIAGALFYPGDSWRAVPLL